MNHELKSTKINKELKRHGLIVYITMSIEDLSYKELLQLKKYLYEITRRNKDDSKRIKRKVRIIN